MSETKTDQQEQAQRLVQVIELDDYRPVWAVARERCRECDNAGIAVVHMGADLDHLQCTFCGLDAAAVTHVETGGDGDNPVWEPRITEDLSDGIIALRH